MIRSFIRFLVAALLMGEDATQQLGAALCRLHFSSTAIALSESIELTLTIEGPAPVEVDRTDRFIDSASWRVLAEPPVVRATVEGREQWSQTFRLMPLETGETRLSFQPLALRTGSEVKERTLRWAPVSIRVSTVISVADLSAARPLRGFEPLASPDESSTRGRGVWVLAISVVGLVLLTGWVYRLGRRRRLRQTEPTAEQRALRALEAAAACPSAETGAQMVADAVRRFLQEQFGISATCQTTTEIVQEMTRDPRVSKEVATATEHLLRDCDQKRFAGRRWESSPVEDLVREGRRLIEAMAEDRKAGEGK